MLERLLVALLAGGHVLLEGVPGLAKTLTVRTLADVLGGTFRASSSRPDLVPADLVGTRIWHPDRGEFRTRARPGVRQPPARRRDQPRARQDAVGAARGDAGAPGHDRRHDATRCRSPFLVLATQNPIESEGTYPLPEAQVDRFLFKVVVDYPDVEDEVAVARGLAGERTKVKEVLDLRDLLRFRGAAEDVHVDREVATYAVRLVDATRNPAAHGLPGPRGPDRVRRLARARRSAWCARRRRSRCCAAAAT